MVNYCQLIPLLLVLSVKYFLQLQRLSAYNGQCEQLTGDMFCIPLHQFWMRWCLLPPFAFHLSHMFSHCRGGLMQLYSWSYSLHLYIPITQMTSVTHFCTMQTVVSQIIPFFLQIVNYIIFVLILHPHLNYLKSALLLFSSEYRPNPIFFYRCPEQPLLLVHIECSNYQ